jgi:SAM-dependent methyltransferase
MDREIRIDLRKAYDRQAPDRDAGNIAEWKIRERADFLSILKKEEKNTLLEIGSGPGRDGLFFLKNGLKVTCIDLSPENINLCREKGLTAYVMDMGNMFFPDNSFDAAYSLNSLLHLSKAELPGVLKDIHHLLQPVGLFYLGMYGGNDFEGFRENDVTIPPRFFSYYTDEHILEVVGQVFDILDFRRIQYREDASHHFQSLFLKKKPELLHPTHKAA